eukprot:COSAG05_NODE_5573_length_1137_cov_1.246628_1_plen_148_part_00
MGARGFNATIGERVRVFYPPSIQGEPSWKATIPHAYLHHATTLHSKRASEMYTSGEQVGIFLPHANILIAHVAETLLERRRAERTVVQSHAILLHGRPPLIHKQELGHSLISILPIGKAVAREQPVQTDDVEKEGANIARTSSVTEF